MEKTKGQLIKEFHTLLNLYGVDTIGKEAILSSYGVESTSDLTILQLREICGRIRAIKGGIMTDENHALTKARQCVLVAIGKYLAAKGDIPATGWKIQEWNIIKGVAKRAAQGDFNSIPLSKLRGITYEFNKQRKAMMETRNFISTNL